MAHGQRSRRRRPGPWKSLNRSVVNNSPPQTQIQTKTIIRYVTSTSVQTESEMPQTKKKTLSLVQNLESVNRIVNLPIVETGWSYAENFYQRVKKSNGLFYWTLEQAENTVLTVVDTAEPALTLLQGPITSIDKLVCKSLDMVEEKIPSINLPPEMIYWNTKQYAKDVSTKMVRPVLKRADSVKQIGNTVLASKYTVYAADTLDGALNVADKYVDKYLRPDDDQNVDEVDKSDIGGLSGKAIHTIHHADRLGRKVTRRLTKLTMNEVKVLKEHSAEAVHVLVYVAELIATDPKLAFQKGKELYASLSENEPENQARPENLEELVVLLTRESARRIVHLINFSGSMVRKVPKRVTDSALTIVNKFLNTADSMVKNFHLEGAQKSVLSAVRYRAHHAALTLKELNVRLTDVLEHLAQTLSVQENPKAALSVPQINIQQLKATHTINSLSKNGIDNNS